MVQVQPCQMPKLYKTKATLKLKYSLQVTKVVNAYVMPCNRHSWENIAGVLTTACLKTSRHVVACDILSPKFI